MDDKNRDTIHDYTPLSIHGNVMQVSDGTSFMEIIIVQNENRSCNRCCDIVSILSDRYVVASHSQCLEATCMCALSTIFLDSPNPVLFGNHRQDLFWFGLFVGNAVCVSTFLS